jgi:hypothetical protein
LYDTASNPQVFCDDMAVLYSGTMRSERFMIKEYLGPLEHFSIIKLKGQGTHRVNLD